MKKKVVLISLYIVIALMIIAGIVCLVLVACDECDEHIDENNDGICDECEWDFDHEHTYAWSYDFKDHWHAPDCGHDVDIKNKAPHVDADNNGECDVCRSGGIELPEVEF